MLNAQPIEGTQSKTTFDDVVEAVGYGGWPGIADLNQAQSQEFCRAYLEETARTRLLEDVKFDPVRMHRLFLSLARNNATNAKITTL